MRRSDTLTALYGHVSSSISERMLTSDDSLSVWTRLMLLVSGIIAIAAATAEAVIGGADVEDGDGS